MIERCLAVVLQWTLTTFNDLVATEVYNDVLFVSEKNKNVWWYDGEYL